MYNCNLHSSYLNLDILDQAEHTVSRRSLFPINKMERVFGEWPHWIGKLVFSGFWWFPRSSIISQCSGHFLVSHSLPVAFSFSPKLGKFFFVFWYKLKDAFGFIYPLNTSCHLGITQGFLKVFEQSALLPAFSSLLLENSRWYQLVFRDVLQRLVNIPFKIQVCSIVNYCSPVIHMFLCRQHTIAVGISSDMRTVVDESRVVFVIWGVLKISSWMLPQYLKSIFKCLTQLVLFNTSNVSLINWQFCSSESDLASTSTRWKQENS